MLWASRSASRRAPPASVSGASTANSVALSRPTTSDSRAVDFSALTQRTTAAPRISLAGREQHGCAGRDAWIGAQRATQLDPLLVRQVGVDNDHVGTGGARPLQRVAAGALAQYPVPAGLEQAFQPVSSSIAIPYKERQRHPGRGHSIAHPIPPGDT